MDIIEERELVCDAMDAYGGSFIKALGTALRYADKTNTEKIRMAFPLYWNQYLDFGMRDKKRRELEEFRAHEGVAHGED